MTDERWMINGAGWIMKDCRISMKNEGLQDEYEEWMFAGWIWRMKDEGLQDYMKDKFNL